MKIMLVKEPNVYRICKTVRDRTNAELEEVRERNEKARVRQQCWDDIMAWASAVGEETQTHTDSARRKAAKALRRLANRVAP